MKRLEWLYNSEIERDVCNWSNVCDIVNVYFKDEEFEDLTGEADNFLYIKDDRFWWELDSAVDRGFLNLLI